MAPTGASALRVLLLLLLCCLIFLSGFASASVEKVCKKITAAEDARLSYEACVRILKSHPGSATADERGLAVIAGNLGSKKAKSNLEKIASLLKTAGERLSGPLGDCRELYNEAMEKLSAAAAAAKGSRYADANIYFSFGMDAAGTCEDGFSEMKLRSPLAAEDGEFYQICDIGAALTYTGP